MLYLSIRIIQAVDYVASRLVVDNTSHSLILTDTVALEVWDLMSVSAADFSLGLQLKHDVNGNASSLRDHEIQSLSRSARPDHETTDSAISISSDFIEDIITSV